MKKKQRNDQPQSMRSTINHLIQLQELTLIRDEQRALHGAHTEISEINKNIDAMIASLDPEVRMNFNRLYKNDHIVMAPMNDGLCSMCGMRIATSQIQAVKLCRNLIPCPSCARTLYDQTGAKWVAERQTRSSAERKSGIARFSSPDLMLTDLQGKTSSDAIAEFAASLKTAGFVDDAEKLAESAIARENILATGVGHGIAFPHVRGIEGGGLALAFGVSKKGVPFQNDADDTAHFVFFSTIPTAVSAFYLRLIAGLTEAFTKEVNRKAALEAETPQELWQALRKATRYTIK